MGQSNHQFVTITNGYPSINIGAMRHAITIQGTGPTSPPTFDASGVASGINFSISAQAAIDYVRGTDVIRGGQTTSQQFLSVAIWWESGILPSMTVLNDNGSTYEIQSIDNVLEMDVVLILNCIGLGGNV